MMISPRKEGMTSDECIEYLEQEHAPLVKELPNLKRFTTSIPRAPDWVGCPLDPDGTRYDLMAEFQFESLEDLKATLDSDEGRRVLQDAHNFVAADESVMIVIDDETLRHRAIPSDI